MFRNLASAVGTRSGLLFALFFAMVACQSTKVQRSAASVSYSSCYNSERDIGITKEGNWPQWELVSSEFEDDWVVAEVVESGVQAEEYEATETPPYGGDLSRVTYKGSVVKLYKPRKIDDWTFAQGDLIATIDNMTCTYSVQRGD